MKILKQAASSIPVHGHGDHFHKPLFWKGHSSGRGSARGKVELRAKASGKPRAETSQTKKSVDSGALFQTNSVVLGSVNSLQRVDQSKGLNPTHVTQSMPVKLGIVSLRMQTSPAERLAHHVANWQLVTKDQWILNTVKGYQIAFISQPYQSRKPHPSQFSLAQQQLVNQEITELCSKGAVTQLTVLPAGTSSQHFSCPEKRTAVRDQWSI